MDPSECKPLPLNWNKRWNLIVLTDAKITVFNNNTVYTYILACHDCLTHGCDYKPSSRRPGGRGRREGYIIATTSFINNNVHYSPFSPSSHTLDIIICASIFLWSNQLLPSQHFCLPLFVYPLFVLPDSLYNRVFQIHCFPWLHITISLREKLCSPRVETSGHQLQLLCLQI